MCKCLGRTGRNPDYPSPPTMCLGQPDYMTDEAVAACDKAEMACWLSCGQEQCACDVNRISVTEEHCGIVATGRLPGMPDSSEFVSAAAVDVLPEPVDVAPISSVPLPTSMYALGGLMAALLACIASVLCFAICIRPLVITMRVSQTKIGYDVVNEDEDVSIVS